MRSEPAEPSCTSVRGLVRIAGVIMLGTVLPAMRAIVWSYSASMLLSWIPVPGMNSPAPYPTVVVAPAMSPSASIAETWVVLGERENPSSGPPAPRSCSASATASCMSEVIAAERSVSITCSPDAGGRVRGGSSCCMTRTSARPTARSRGSRRPPSLIAGSDRLSSISCSRRTAIDPPIEGSGLAYMLTSPTVRASGRRSSTAYRSRSRREMRAPRSSLQRIVASAIDPVYIDSPSVAASSSSAAAMYGWANDSPSSRTRPSR
jgi:hypothetical protein